MDNKVTFTPTGGVDYPRTLEEFLKFFPDEVACLTYLEHVRWRDEFVCPGCGNSATPWRSSRKLLLCPKCRRQVSVTSGTIFEGTRKPILLWLHVMWQMTSQKYGTNALGLQRVMGFGSYLTAWAWLHKLRRAMVRPDRDKLRGTVEVDESYVGGEETGVRGRQTIKKAIIAIAIEITDSGFGRIRLRHIPDVSGKSLISFVADAVELSSVVQTDGWKGYSQLGSAGYIHEVTILSNYPDPSHVLMPGVHRVASLLKRWLLGTLQGGVSLEYLPYYLDEFSFRFNRRTSRSRGLLFYRLVSQAVQTDHISTTNLFVNKGS